MNQFYTDRPGANGTKHIYAGTTRIASKLMRQDTPGANPNGKTPFEKDLYFFHPDHIGSTNYVTDLNGKLYEHLEYFPFGEGWIEENTNQQRTPYLFSAKELDEETGLYYFGARYYDPRTSVWQSADPILGRYLSEKGERGVFAPPNLGVYTYGYNNPIRFTDPTGTQSIDEAIFKLRPWNAANAIGTFQKGADNISTVATRFAYTGATPEAPDMILSGEVPNARTGEANAMRHVPWQAIIAGEFSPDVAKQAGDAHEGGRPGDMTSGVISSYPAADLAVDQRNNAIGREIGEANKGKSRVDVAKATLEKFHKEGFWTAHKTKNGFELKQQKLSDDKYKAYKDALQRQDENGRWVKQDSGGKTDSK